GRSVHGAPGQPKRRHSGRRDDDARDATRRRLNSSAEAGVPARRRSLALSRVDGRFVRKTRARRIARGKGLACRLVDGRGFGLVLTGAQTSLGFEPVFLGAPDRPTALFPEPVCELPLLPYVELRGHGSSPSVSEPRTMLADGCTQ